MAAAVATARKSARGGGTTASHGPWWWGAGAPPTELWPGVSLDFPTIWSSRNGRWESPSGLVFFDAAAADKACDFFPDILRHHIGEFAGRPFVLMEYQAKLLTRPLFGWKQIIDGFRLIRKLFAFIPKGGGKSPWAAGTGVYLVRCDGEPAAEVYALANDRLQARTVHTNAKYMVEDSLLLSDGVEILKDSIYWVASRSTYMVLSSDASSAHGKRPHGLIFDELHGYTGDKDRELFEALKKSLIKRRQPALIMITHSGTDDEGVCHQEYEYAKGVLSGTIPDRTHLPVIFEAVKGEDWMSPEVHARVNPGYGITVKADAVETECLEAKSDPRKQNDFKRYHLNIWVNQATAWIPIEWFDACQEPLDDAELVLLDCAAGLDLAQKWDLAAFVVCFRKYLKTTESIEVVAEDAAGKTAKKSIEINYKLYARPFFWIPENTMLQHEKEDGVPYSIWRKNSIVTATEGDIIDYNRIYTDITTKILPRYPRLKQGMVGYDPAFATDIATKLRDVAGLPIVEILQNYKMFSEPSQIIEALMKGKRFAHDGNPLYRSNWEHVAIKTDDAGRIRPVKPKRRSKRVDGAVATIMADKVLSLRPAAQPAARAFVI